MILFLFSLDFSFEFHEIREFRYGEVNLAEIPHEKLDFENVFSISTETQTFIFYCYQHVSKFFFFF